MGQIIIPKIKSYDCADHDPIEDWTPENPRRVDFWMNFSIGLPDKEGADNFQVHVLTEEMLKPISAHPKHSIVLQEYSWPTLLLAMNSVVKSCGGSDWDEISQKLSASFGWEFESYQPYRG